jgi:hypothetical protein
MKTDQTPAIGNRSDAISLLDYLLEEMKIDQETTTALEALRDALEREIV